jgi:hypothetical protein
MSPILSLRRALLPALLPALIAALLLAPRAALASEPCNPPNVIPQPVCDMDNWYGSPPRELPEGWTPFILSGDPTYMRDEHSFYGGGTLRMWSVGGTFKAGIYTVVPVTPGAGYRASIAWGAPNAPDLFGRQLGIDPTGGVDPNAPTVIWGPMHFGEGRILNYTSDGPNIDVKARAVGDTMTVFFLVDHPNSSGDNLIFIDAIALYPDESAPAAIEPPTPTPEPPTPTPEPPPAEVAEVAAAQVAPVLPTDTPTALPTETPTPVPPTATPTATPSPTPSPTATPTATPTWTPWPTATEGALLSLDGAQTRLAAAAGDRAGAELLAFSALSFMGALVFGGSLWAVHRRK